MNNAHEFVNKEWYLYLVPGLNLQKLVNNFKDSIFTFYLAKGANRLHCNNYSHHVLCSTCIIHYFFLHAFYIISTCMYM